MKTTSPIEVGFTTPFSDLTWKGCFFVVESQKEDGSMLKEVKGHGIFSRRPNESESEYFKMRYSKLLSDFVEKEMGLVK